jgi:hypothetical protein
MVWTASESGLRNPSKNEVAMILEDDPGNRHKKRTNAEAFKISEEMRLAGWGNNSIAEIDTGDGSLASRTFG